MRLSPQFANGKKVLCELSVNLPDSKFTLWRDFDCWQRKVVVMDKESLKVFLITLVIVGLIVGGFILDFRSWR
jgi:hypothetical protein